MKNKNIYFLSILIIALILTGCTTRQGTAIREKGIISGTIKIDENLQITKSNLPEFTADKTVTINTHKVNTASINPQELIIEFNSIITPGRIKSQILEDKGALLKKIGPSTYKIKLSSVRNNIMEKLNSHPLVSCVEYDYPLSLQNIPDDPFYPQQWNLEILGMEKVWDETRGDRDIVVAVIDTGILPGHPDLKNNITAGYDFVDEDSEPLDTSPHFSHGTHVAGIIGAVGNNNTGIAGINWQVKIMPIRVMGPEGNGGYSNLISGINWAVENGARIINLSLAGSYYSESLRNAIINAVDSGITVIAAAGNNGTTPVLYPAKYPEVISVGAVGPEKEIAPYSNYGPDLDLVAPGGNSSNYNHNNSTIISTSGYLNNQQPVYQYIQAEGTSMATPHVSGIVALLYSKGLTDPRTIKNRLLATAIDLGTPGRDDKYGAGLINIKEILNIPDDEVHAPINSNQYDHKLSSVKIIVTEPGKDTVSSNHIVYPDSKGRFSIEIREGKWKIIAWLDTDHSQHINEGDYYSESKNINIKPGEAITGLELTLGILNF